MFNKWFLVLTLVIVILNISCKINPTISKHSAPTAIFTIAPTSGTTTTTFMFDASSSSDNEDATSVLQVRWDWENDGNYDTNYSTTKTAIHQYVTHGTYTVKLEVKDSAGLTHTTTKTATVSNTVPIASFTVDPTSGTTATTFTFDASGSNDNEDATSALEVRWDWENDGNYDSNYSTAKTAIHQYNTSGTYTVKLEVKDSKGLTHTTTMTIDVYIVIIFADANFETLIRETLNKLTGDITNIDLGNITEIEGEGRNISDVSGIEYCTNLEILNLWSNQIVDISTLSSLTNLQVLNLNSNQIIDIDPLIQNNGIDNNDIVYLNDNPLSETSINTYIPQLEGRGVTVYYGIGLSDPFFGFISENWILQYEKGPMNSIWESEGINREGYNYYFFPKAVSPYDCSDRFIPTSNYFQSWFGMYTVSDNSDGTYALNNLELNQEDILKLAIADQKAWLRGFAGLDTPSVYLDNSVEIIKEKIMIDSQNGWKLSGRLISNVDVGNNNQINVPDIIKIKKQYWEDKVNSYQQVYLDAYAYVWYAPENKELNVAYFNGVKYLSKDGTTYRTIEKIYSELEEMILNVTVYE